jgi:tetratricopeptide (TPR) repeat protein
MGILQRLFSSDYRKAVAAEAEGDYVTAARHFALCGHRHRVADMHLAQARMEKDAERRVEALRSALAFSALDDSRRPMILRLLGRALRDRAVGETISSDERRELLLESAAMLEEGESWEPAGDCYLEVGDRNRAAAAYSKAGLVERVEEVLSQAEEEHHRIREEDSCFKDYEVLLQGGQRDQAAEALRACVEVAQQQGDYRRLLADLEARLLTNGRVVLEVARRTVVLIGHFPVVLGRGDDCDLQLRGTSASRRHARILYEKGQGFLIADCESRNGTLLNGMLLGQTLALPPSGVVGLGDSCELRYTIADSPAGHPVLRLEAGPGMDQGRVAVVTAAPCELSQVIDGGPPVQITFSRGRPFARATRGQLLLNRALAGQAAQLIKDDLLELEEQTVRVTG